MSGSVRRQKTNRRANNDTIEDGSSTPRKSLNQVSFKTTSPAERGQVSHSVDDSTKAQQLDTSNPPELSGPMAQSDAKASIKTQTWELSQSKRHSKKTSSSEKRDYEQTEADPDLPGIAPATSAAVPSASKSIEGKRRKKDGLLVKSKKRLEATGIGQHCDSEEPGKGPDNVGDMESPNTSNLSIRKSENSAHDPQTQIKANNTGVAACNPDAAVENNPSMNQKSVRKRTVDRDQGNSNNTSKNERAIDTAPRRLKKKVSDEEPGCTVSFQPKDLGKSMNTLQEKKHLASQLVSVHTLPLRQREEIIDNVALPSLSGELAYNPNDDDPEAGQDTTHEIALKVKYSILVGETPKRKGRKCTFKCGIGEYMTWKFIVNSPDHVISCNEHFRNSGDIILNGQPTPDLHINAIVNSGTHVEQVVVKVIRFALNVQGEQIIVKPINANKINDVQRNFPEENGIHIFEDTDMEHFVVFERRLEDRIKPVMDGETELRDNQIIEKKFSLPRIFHKFTDQLEKKIRTKHKVTIKCETSEDMSMVIIVITGKADDIGSIDQEIEAIRTQLKKQRAQLGITSKQSVGELDIEKDLDKLLYTNGHECVTKIKGQKIYVYGFDDNCVSDACTVVGTNVIETNVSLTDDSLKRMDGILKEKCSKEITNGKVSIHRDNCHVYIVGLKVFVEKTTGIIQRGLNESQTLQKKGARSKRSSKSQVSSATRTETKTVKHQETPTHSETVDSVVDDNNSETEVQMHVTATVPTAEQSQNVDDRSIWKLPTNKKLIVQKCSADSTAATHITKLKLSKNRKAECATSDDVAVQNDDMSRSESDKKELSELLERNLAKAKNKRVDSIAFSVEPIGQWEFPDFCKCLVNVAIDFANQLTDTDLPNDIVLCTDDQTHFQFAMDYVQTFFQNPDVVKQHDTDCLTEVTVVEGHLDRVDSVEEPGCTEGFKPRNLSKSMNIFQERKDLSSRSVSIHTLPSRQREENTNDNVALPCLSGELAYNRNDDNDPYAVKHHDTDCLTEVTVVEGHLDKIDTDVIVNTTSTNLDLENGTVSRALLRKAGKKLQKECAKNYPNGIRHGDIAITKGYNIGCKYVIHVSLRNYKTDFETECIQALKELTASCLQWASKNGMRSIAFPAFGTGVLKYPVTMVATEMFNGVETFKRDNGDTTLKTVLFVIHPKDRQIIEIFRTIETSLRTAIPFKKPQIEGTVKPRGTSQRQQTKGGTQQRRFSWSTSVGNMKIYQVGSIEIRVYEADILNLPVDCIVNAANKDLKHFGGIAYAIAKSGGKIIQDESDDLIDNQGRLATGDAVRTSAGNLPYKCIVHAVGPSWDKYKTHSVDGIQTCLDDLERTLLNCFSQAETNKLRTIALPSISSGLFGVPKELCAVTYARALLKLTKQPPSCLQEVHFVDINHDMTTLIHKIFDERLNKNSDETGQYDLTKFVSQVPVTSAGEFQATEDSFLQSHKMKSSEPAKGDSRSFELVGTYEIVDGKLICSFENDMYLIAQRHDILHLSRVDAIVCTEDRIGEAAGVIAKGLWDAGGKRYRQEKAKVFQTMANFGDVLVTDGGNNKYSKVLHVIVARKDARALGQVYFNVFLKAVELKLTSLAMTVLGTGYGSFDVTTSASILMEEWVNFCKGGYDCKRLTLHVVSFDHLVAKQVETVFKSYIDSMLNTRFSPDPMGASSNPGISEETAVITKSTPTRKKKNKTLTKLKESSTELENQEQGDDCVICIDKPNKPTKLKCGHTFCTECIENAFKVKKACPTCGIVCGVIIGDQPDGIMSIKKSESPLYSYENYDRIVISYSFPQGKQGKQHPRPGCYYDGVSRVAYLPDTDEGRHVCAMLKIAFERRLVFTIGTSRTTGQEGVITWNDIHHKTDTRPNSQFGYPDPTYLQRVSEELAIKGVTEADIEKKVIQHLQKSATEMKRIVVAVK